MLNFELIKLSIFTSIYFGVELYSFLSKKTENNRKLIEYKNYNRLSVEKTTVAKINSDYSQAASDSLELEVRNNGLVILYAYLGSKRSIKRTKNRLER